MKTSIRAIETEYAGYRFRSRLEARWAFFFSHLTIDWQYEPEGFELEQGGRTTRYLPDFWLPRLRVWVEVKPADPTADEEFKAQALVDGSGQGLYLLIGPPSLDAKQRVYRPQETPLVHCAWSECLCCDPHRVELAVHGAFEIDRRWRPQDEWCSTIVSDSPRMRQAVRGALQERFEVYPPRMRRLLENAGAL